MLVPALLLTLGWDASPARADGELSLRGAYYKERSTRVVQPMMDVALEVGESGLAEGHFLIDSITSASVAAGASGDAFNERRVEVGGGYRHEFGFNRLGGSLRVSNEPDYRSLTGSLRGERDFAERNTTLGFGVAASRDEVTNGGAQGGIMSLLIEELNSVLLSSSVSQLLSTTTIASVTYDYTRVSGFQANPYRSVSAGGMLETERVPNLRHRHAAAGSVRQFIPQTTSTLFGGYRLYADNWGIVGHTPELRLIQELTTGLEMHARYRLHKQSRASFFREIYNSSDPEVHPFLTDDQKLSNHHTQSFGGRLDVTLELFGLNGSWAKTRAEMLFEYILQSTEFKNAVVAQFALAIPFDY